MNITSGASQSTGYPHETASNHLFSKNEEIHDNVIGMYINRYYFTGGSYLESI
jgi:hypothetical protein